MSTKKPSAKAETPLTTRELLLRYIDKDGKSHVVEHIVWDAEKFFQARSDEAKKSGGRVELA